jgi:hypothetical protein
MMENSNGRHATVGNAGLGAVAGAGGSLLVGATAGAGASQASSPALQQRNDMTYLRCMFAKGKSVPTR